MNLITKNIDQPYKNSIDLSIEQTETNNKTPTNQNECIQIINFDNFDYLH